MTQVYPTLDIYQLYKCFNAPLTAFDCGQLCSIHNLSGKLFCCDICHAVPAAYHQEWAYLKDNTALWHVWRGDECLENATDPSELLSDIPEHMLLLACQGPAHCQRNFRTLGCRPSPPARHVLVASAGGAGAVHGYRKKGIIIRRVQLDAFARDAKSARNPGERQL